MNRLFKKISIFPFFACSKPLSAKLFPIVLVILPLCISPCYAQIVPDNYGNNSSRQWVQIKTRHFKIVFHKHDEKIIKSLAPQAEQIFREYKVKLGTSPARKITLYLNDKDEIVSGIHALNTDYKYSIWIGKPFKLSNNPQGETLHKKLRKEIAYAFQTNIKYFPIDYYFYLFSNPSKKPWSDGLVSYLANPKKTPYDVSAIRSYRQVQQQRKAIIPPRGDVVNVALGRSQLHYFNQAFAEDSLQKMYGHRNYLFGFIPYFDFNHAFKHATEINYDAFAGKWKKNVIQKNESPVNEQAGEQVIKQKGILSYRGGALNLKDSLVAVISLPNTGSFDQELRVIPLTKKLHSEKGKNISNGHFDSQMDWNASKKMLVFAKRLFNQKKGTYYYQIRIWHAEDGLISKVTDRQDAKLPSFSPDGNHLVYVQNKALQEIIWLQNLTTGARQKLHTFHAPVSVTSLHYHPSQQKILVGFRNEHNYKTGILGLNNRHWSLLSLQAQVPLHAHWSAGGSAIYFDKISHKVVNIFKAHWSGQKITSQKAVTKLYYGTELWDVSGNSTGKSYLLANTAKPDFDSRLTVYSGNAEVDQSSTTYSVNQHSQAGVQSDAGQEMNRTASTKRLKTHAYKTFLNTKWKVPSGVPYIYGGDFGALGYLTLSEPTRTHQFNYYGFLSLDAPVHKSFFYSDYVNTMFRPRLELNFNHFPAASGFFGPSRRNIKTSNVVALTSLWKLTGLSHNFSDWYAGLTVRYLAEDYFSPATLQENHPTVILDNTNTTQTDVRATLAWHALKPNRNTLIHPLSGAGARFTISGTDKFFKSKAKFLRLNLDGYKVLPAFGKQRIFLYGNGVVDFGQPIGADFLNFDDAGNYQLPGPQFIPKVTSGINRFIRGYSNPLLGNRFLFGRIEYRIPFEFNTRKKIFGIIPPARTSLTFFSDAGVMGDARTAPAIRQTKARYSVGAEIKRVFSFGGSFEVTYEAGIAQPLTQSFGLSPFVNLDTALPF